MEHNEPTGESTQEQIQQIPTPEIGNTETQKLADLARQNALLVDALRSTNDRLLEKDREIAEVRRPVAPPRNIEDERESYFKDPVGTNARLVEEALERRMAPFQKFIEKIQNDSVVDTLINNAKQNPHITSKWNAPLESYIRSNVGSLNPLNDNSFNALVMAALGAQAIGLIESPTQVPSSTNMRIPSSDRIMPPNVPSTRSAPLSDSNNINRRRELTEEERRLAREMRMSDAEYLEFLEMDRREVIKSEVGKAPKGGN